MSRFVATFIATFITIALATLSNTSVSAANKATAWRLFFQRAIPAAKGNFVSIRAVHDVNSGDYSVKGPLDSGLVSSCQIFQTGALENTAWHLRCQVADYGGQAVGPATAEGTLTQDLTAALPQFKRGRNLMGEPQWLSSDHHTSVTIVFGGILITHGNTEI